MAPRKTDEMPLVTLATLTPRLLSVDAAAAYLGIGAWTLRAMAADGKVPMVTPPAVRRTGQPMRRVLFDVRDLDALIEKWKREHDGVGD